MGELAASLARVRPFPAAAATVRELVNDPKSQLADVAHAVESDPGVSTDLLRLANAPTSGLRYECTSVRQAVTLLGLRRICTIVDAAAALSMLEGAHRRPVLARHALAVAGVMRMLAPIAAIPPDEAFATGLLHDIGVLLLAESGDVFYEALIDEVGDASEVHVEDEVELVGYDHATIGGAVLRLWNLPEQFARVVELHHNWEATLPEEPPIRMLVSLLRAAEAVVTWVPLLEANPTPADMEPLFIEPAFEHLGITRNELATMWDGLTRASMRSQTVAPCAPTDRVERAGPPPLPKPGAATRPVAEPLERPWSASAPVVITTIAAALAVGAFVYFFVV